MVRQPRAPPPNKQKGRSVGLRCGLDGGAMRATSCVRECVSVYVRVLCVC